MNDARRATLFAAVFALGATFLRAPMVTHGLPAARDPDGAKTVGVAAAWARDWRSGHFTLDPGTYQYPTLQPLALAVTFTIFPTRVDREAAGRAWALAAGVAAVPIASALAFVLAGLPAAVAAGMFTAFGFSFAMLGRTPAPDALQMTLTGAAALALLVEAGRPPRAWSWGGFLAGLAAGAKYTAPLFIAPFALWAIARSGRGRRAAGVAGAAVAGFLIATPSIVWRAPQFIERFRAEGAIQRGGGFGGGVPGFFGYATSTDTIPTGHPFANSVAGEMGFLYLAAVLASVMWAARQFRRGGDARPALFALSIAGGYLFFSLSSRIQAMRFLLPASFFAAVLLAVALAQLAVRWRPSHAGVAAAVMAGLLLVPGAARWHDLRAGLARPDTRLAAAEWILGNVPAGARVLNFMYGPALPAGRFDLAAWQLPEYQAGLGGGGAAVPSLARARTEGVRWVVVNSFYHARFFRPARTQDEAAYALAWREFLRDVSEASVRREAFLSQGGPYPDVEVFELSFAP